MKKNKKVTGAVSAALIATAIALFGINNTVMIEGTYKVSKVDDNRSAISISIPEEVPADIWELYLGDTLIDKALLPKGKIITIPALLNKPELLDLKVYRLKKVIGVGKLLEDGRLEIAVKKGVMGVEK